MDSNDNKTIMNTQDLNNAIRVELNRQNTVINQLSKDSGIEEHIIRNMMNEKRPVVKKKENLTAYNMFVEVQNRKSQGKDKDYQVIWDSLDSEQKLAYQIIANQHNLEHRYSEVKFISNPEERLNTLKDECGFDFLVITIEPKELPETSFGFGSLLADDFCIEQPEEVLQISKKLYNYGESTRNLQNETEQADLRNDRFESLIDQTLSSNYQLSSTNENAKTDISEETESELSTSLTESNCTNFGGINEEAIETDYESDDDKTVCDDERDLIKQDPLYELLGQDYMTVQLDNRLKSAVRKFLRARFYSDTGKITNIPYKDWENQTKYSVTGWPKHIKFDDWGRIKEKREVYRHLLNIHFHVNEEAPEYKRFRSSNKKKRRLV
ncbi:19904_t:CDS:2 [Funneliformis geosporum]|uniref:8089_t:CDS:1 n=1 Tax=Funneliformis geosporum TaxID=1117311 RepID=A0A9W4WNL7_9GLOM|nr:19904_t:CDS:2 [Funneliformis geosporum]CAI2175330.1 8089_t:CDS:2 [Funneliformis geosporum]